MVLTAPVFEDPVVYDMHTQPPTIWPSSPSQSLSRCIAKWLRSCSQGTMHHLGVKKTKMGAGDKNTGYFLQDFLVQRLAYLFIVVAVFLCIAAFVTQSELSSGRKKVGLLNELLAKKERTLEWRKGVITEKTDLLHSTESKLGQINEVMSTKQRTLEWRKSVISEKQAEIDRLNGVVGEHEDLLARKQRTLEWRRQVADEKQRELTMQTKRDKRQLFEFRKVHALSEKAAHAKLVKLMTVMQNFLTREKKTQNIIKVSKQHLHEALEHHRAQVKSLSSDLSPSVSEKLEQLGANLLAAVGSTMDFATDEIVGESAVAEQRLETLTHDLIDQLKSNIESEREDFKLMEMEDPEAFANFQQHQKHGDSSTQEKDMQLAAEEKDFMKMIQEFYATVKGMGNFQVSEKTMKDAKQLLTNVRRGEVDYIAGSKKMKGVMDKHHIKYKSKANIVDQFAQWLQAAKFAPEKENMLAKLDQWQNGLLGDAEMMLYIEEKVAAGVVALEWFVDAKNKAKDLAWTAVRLIFLESSLARAALTELNFKL